MRRFLLGIGILVLVVPTSAGVIVLKNNKKIICEGPYEIKGQFLLYKDRLGQLLQLPLKMVDLEKSSPEDPDKDKGPTAQSLYEQQERERAQKNQKFWEEVHEELSDRLVTAPDLSMSQDRIERYALMHRANEGKTQWDSAVGMFALYLAIQNRDIENMKEILKEPFPLQGSEYESRSMIPPLFHAIYQNWIPGVESLVDAGADVNYVFQDTTPLQYALSRKTQESLKIAFFLLDRNANPNVQDNEGYIPLHYAINFNNLPLLAKLLEKNSWVDTTTPDRTAPLFLAIERYQLEAVKLLLDHGAATDIHNGQGRTPLMESIYLENPKIYELLDQTGSAPLDLGNPSLTPTEYAVDIDKPKMLAYLFSKVEPSKLKVDIFLVSAMKRQSHGVAEYLLSREADPNAHDEEGNPVLNIAAANGDLRMVKTLLAAGADPYQKGKTGLSAYAVADGEKKTEIRSLLKERFKASGDQ